MDVYAFLKELAGKDVQLIWVPGTRTVVLAIMSEKGGVGKTAMTTGLAAVAAAAGLQVVVIDLDPRGTTTAELGITEPAWSVNDLLYVDPKDPDPIDITGAAAEAFLPAGPAWPGTVRVLAAERALGNRETDIETPMLEQRLKMALAGALEGVDLVLMDVPPRPGGKLVSAAFLAATHGIIPATLDEDGFVGARDMLLSIRKMRAHNPGFELVGIARNIVDGRYTGLAEMYDRDMSKHFGELWLPDVAVPRYVLRQESRSACIPFTSASSPERQKLQRGYTGVLNAVWRRAA